MIEIFNILFLISIFSLNIFFIHYLFLFCENNLSRSVKTKDLDTSIISFLFIILLGLVFNLDIKILGIFFLAISFITILFFLFFKIKLENYQLLIIFFFLSIYGSISILVDLEIGHDAQKFYIPRSIDIFFNGIDNDIDSGFDKNRSIPLYGPYAWATFRYSSIISNEIFGRLLSLFLFNFTYLILISRLLVKDNIKNLLFILFFFLTFNNYHFDGKLDIFVFIINVLISIVFYDVLFNKKNSNSNLIKIIILMSILLWIKNECIVYFFSYLILLILFTNYKPKNKLFFFICVTLIFFIKMNYLNNYNTTLNPDKETLEINYILSLGFYDIFLKVLMTIKWYFLYLFKNIHFLILIPVIIYSLFVFKMDDKVRYFFLIFIVLNFLAIISVYSLTKFPMPFHLIASLDRFMFQYSGFYMIFVLIFFNQITPKK